LIELLDPDDHGRWSFSISDRTSLSFSRNQDGVIDALRMHEGAWSFEAPRKGVPIVPEIDEAELQKYLGTYRIAQMDADLAVVIHHHRLTLDKSSLPGKRPADLFELYPPDDEGRWVYRINGSLHVVFDQESDGSISGLRIFEHGNLEVTAAHSTKGRVTARSLRDLSLRD
jgi:hypothetical protein